MTLDKVAHVHLNAAMREVEAVFDVPLLPVRLTSMNDSRLHVLAAMWSCHRNSTNGRRTRNMRDLANTYANLYLTTTDRWEREFGNVAARVYVTPRRALIRIDERIFDTTAEPRQAEATIYHEVYHVGLRRYALASGVAFNNLRTIPHSFEEGFAETSSIVSMRERYPEYLPSCSEEYLEWASELLVRARSVGCQSLREIADLVLRDVPRSR